MKHRKSPLPFTDEQLSACMRVWPHMSRLVDKEDAYFAKRIAEQAADPAWKPTLNDTGKMRTLLDKFERRETQVLKYLKQSR